MVPNECVGITKVLLSLGISDDWTFDADFLNRNNDTRVIGVDHTISGGLFLRKILKHTVKAMLYRMVFHWHKADKNQKQAKFFGTYFTLYTSPSEHLRLCVADADGVGKISFKSLMERASTKTPNSVFVKCDIEGAEYEIVRQIVDHAAEINGLVLEFHYVDVESDVFNRAVELLLSKFNLVHIHGNNFGSFNTVINFPDSVEITFISKTLMPGQHEYSTQEYPVPNLDIPNSPALADFPIAFE